MSIEILKQDFKEAPASREHIRLEIALLQEERSPYPTSRQPRLNVWGNFVTTVFANGSALEFFMAYK